MKQRVLREYLPAWLLLAICGGLVIHAPLTVWLTAHGAPVWVKAWKEILLMCAAISLLPVIIREKKWQMFGRWLLLPITLYAVLHLIYVVGGSENIQVLAMGLLIDLRYIGYFVVVYAFLSLYPQYRDSFIRVGVAGATLVVGFAMLQLVLPHDVLKYIGYSSATIKPYILLDDNPDYVRFNSTLRGPNPLGAYAMMVLLGVVAYGMVVGRTLKSQSRKWLHAFLMLGGLTAMWVSYSRSAVIGLVAGLLALFASSFHGSIGRRQIVAVCLAIVSIGLIGYGLRDTDVFKNLVLHDNPLTGARLTSDQGHASSLAEGFRRMLDQPFGAGVGSTGSASLAGDKPFIIENYYLMVAHEVGWVGVMLFMLIWGVLLRMLWLKRTDWIARIAFASGIGLAVIAITWPVLADDTVSMIWWGWAAVALAPVIMTKGKKYGATTNKKTT